MRAFRHEQGSHEGEDGSGMDSERENESLPEEEGDELEELISDFISAPDPNAPDLDVVSRLYLEFFRHFVGVFERKANDRSRAQDAVQQAFTALQVHYNTHGALPDDPRSFLFIAAQNWLVDQARKDSSHREVPLQKETAETAQTMIDPQAREAIQAMESSEIRGVANPVVEKFDETTRKIIELRRQGKEFEEIAKQVGLSAKTACKKYERAIRRVKRALGEHFSSFISSGDHDERRWVNSRRSAEQAIDLLPSPYNKVVFLRLVKKMTEQEIAARLGVSVGEVKRHYEHGLELFYKQSKLTEDDLLDVIWHSGE